MIPRTPVKKVRAKPRPGRLKGEALEMLRADCYLRDFGVCQECGELTVFNAPHEWGNSFHMAHIQAKRRGGDSLDNVRVLCRDCHLRSHQYGPSFQKPCPEKPKEVA